MGKADGSLKLTSHLHLVLSHSLYDLTTCWEQVYLFHLY